MFEAGARDERHRLIGAYSGITLAALRRLASRYDWGGLQYLLCRYEGGSLIVRPLRDGYYLLIALSPGVGMAEGLYRTDDARTRMNEEI